MLVQPDALSLTVGSQCILKNAPEHLKKELRSVLTIANPKFQAAKKYGRWVGKKFPQKLYFFKERKAGFIMPRGFAKEAVIKCIEILGVKPEIVDERRLLSSCDFQFSGVLREYQEQAVRDIVTRDFGVLEAGTGSGKTVVALKVIALRAQPAIVLVHTKELLYQWAERVSEFLGVEAGLIGDGKAEIRPVTVAIVNSAKKHIDDLPRQFGHLLVDECHRVPASLFTDVVTSFDAKYSLGLSATAYRREDILTRLIYFYMGARVHKVDAAFLHESGAVLKPEIRLRPTEFAYQYRDDYSAMLKALAADEQRNRLIAQDVVLSARKTDGVLLVVSDRVAHCQRLAELISAQGVSVSVLTGKDPVERRAKVVEEIKKSSVKVLISTLQLIGEGFDAPQLSTLFLATPIKFSGRLKQVVGRILRPATDKKALVYDYVDENVSILRNSANERSKTYFLYDC
nr:DEAD/DEAH box helicase [Desulfobulbaceae bacterium]